MDPCFFVCRIKLIAFILALKLILDWKPGGTHQFRFMTLDIDLLWMVNHYGGAAEISPEDYYAATPQPPPLS